MASTVIAMKSLIRSWLGGRTDKDDLVLSWLNTSQIRIARFHDFLNLKAQTKAFELVADTEEYNYSDVSAQCKTILNIRLPDVIRTLDYVETSWFNVWVPYPEGNSTATPSMWYNPREGVFSVYPIPDATYEAHIRYTSWSSSLTSDTDELAFENMDDVVLYGALTEAYLSIQQYTDAETMRRTFYERLREAIATDRHQPAQALYMGVYRPRGRRLSMNPDHQSDPWYGIRRR